MRPEAAPSEAAPHQARDVSLPVDTTPGFHARLRLGPSRESMSSNWRDITVPDESDRGRAVCLVLLEAERATLATVPLESEVVRPCELTLLPASTSEPGLVLVDERTVDDLDLRLLAAPSLEGEDLSNARATITAFTQFENPEACLAMRAQLMRAREETSRRNAANAEAFLAEVLEHRERERQQACEHAAEAQARCASHPTEELDVLFCSIEMPMRLRLCDQEAALITMLEERRGVAPEAPPPPACLPRPGDDP